MAILTLRATEYNDQQEVIQQHENIEINTEQFLIIWLGNWEIKYQDIIHHPADQTKWPAYVELPLENNHTLRLYVQHINNNRTMSHELYELLLKE